MIIKLGEAVTINAADFHPLNKLASDIDLDIERRMQKFAHELKVIAPQAKDFLYFTAVMMHAAEAALINEDGSKKLMSNGEPVTATWEKVGKEGVKWVCSDKNILPYRNSNRDIFGEFELKKAYRLWIGRPLCLDHQSDSVDKIRGVIVDTVYDDKRHRVIALCALDAKNYPDLADKVKTAVSTNVSMGTAVGKAICSDCQTVARTEKEFCTHMRNKSCYGEINMDLSPMELSLVVNGADPKAKVKHIIASDVSKAADLLTDYLQLKEASKEISTQDLESIKKDLAKLTDKINGLVDGVKEDESDAAGPTRSTQQMEENIDNSSSVQLNVPEAFPTYASELQRAILGAQVKIASLQENLFRIYKNEEPTMSNKNAYFQGTEEPTPGQKKYPVDPLNEKARQMDKTLVGQPPFPGVGPVDGMYPGDEQTKKDLQRLADEHERALFREAALKKAKEQLAARGYFQGTTEPSAKGNTYTPDPLNEKDRMLDKNMVGKPPFPGVGKTDGLYGDDMATKEKLSRASLKARFEKVSMPDGRIDKSACRWVVIANEKPILAATVDQITKGNSDSLYDAVATERFGKSLLNRIQTEGFHTTAASLLQVKAQAAPAPAAPPPPAAPAAPPVDGMADLVPPDSVGGEAGDPGEIVEALKDLTNEMEGKLSDLEEKVSGPVAEDGEDLDAVPPAGDDAFAAGAAPKTASQLQSMRKRVNGMLQEGISETVASLKNHVKELKTASKVYKESYASMNKTQRDYLNSLAIDAVKDAKAMISDTNKLMTAVVKYAQGTVELQKRAQEMVPAHDVGALGLDDDSPITKALELGIIDPESIGGTIELTPEALDEGWDIKTESGDSYNPEVDIEIVNVNEADKTITVGPEVDFNKEEDEQTLENEYIEEDLKDLFKDIEEGEDMANAMEAKYTPQEGGESIPVKLDGGSLSLASKEARANARIKLAQKGLLGFNELSQQAHPKGSASAVDAGNLDIKPTVPGAAFHVQKDLEKAMLDLANMPPKVRKQAEEIQNLITTGKLASEDVDQLVSHGVDADAVKYWKAMWGAAKDPASKDFANALTSEHAAAKKAEEDAAFKGKVKRAYEMANQMVARGMIAENQVDYQVEDILKYNDAGFNSLKNILAKQPVMSKKASVPVVGMMDSDQVFIPMGSNTKVASGEVDIKTAFDSYFSGKKL